MGRVYSKAPIVEAVIEVRTAHAGNLTQDDLARVHEIEAERYPTVDKRLEVANKIEITEGAISTSAGQRQLGYTFTSHDGLQTAFATMQGFLFSRLAPYGEWDPFYDEAWRLWRIFREETKPERVTRLAVRFVNRINTPAGLLEIKDYLNTYTELAPALPQMLSAFFMQALVPLDEYGAMVNIISGIDPVENGGSLILDLDCFVELDLDTSNEDFDSEMRATLARLREAKNFVFEACITDETRRLID